MDNTRGYGQCNSNQLEPRPMMEVNYQQVMPAEECCLAAPETNHRGYKISIEPLEYGYIVHVGCKTLAIESRHKLIAKLAEYLENPAEAESKWYKGEFKLD